MVVVETSIHRNTSETEKQLQQWYSLETQTLEEEIRWSRRTIIDWKSYLREFYIDWSIGGPGKIVEIDEAKVGKRKYNRGRVVESQWASDSNEVDAQKCEVKNDDDDEDDDYDDDDEVDDVDDDV
ncbi:hypothetical protein ACLKA7_007853 [Drosophila subpalustris]